MCLIQSNNSFVSIVLRVFEHPLCTYSYVNDTMIVRQHKIFIFGVYGSSSLRNRTKRLYKLIVVYMKKEKCMNLRISYCKKCNRLYYISYICDKVDIFYMASNFGRIFVIFDIYLIVRYDYD